MLTYIAREFGRAPVAILSNGTLISIDTLLPLKSKLDISFQISLDGPDAQSHEKIRGPNTFNSTILSIKTLVQNGFDVSALNVLSKRSESFINNFFILAKQLGLSSMNFTRFIPQGYGESLQTSGTDRPLYPMELKAAFSNILNSSKIYKIHTNTDKPLYNLIDNRLGASGKWGFQGLVVDYKGNLKVSSRIDLIVGNLFDTNMATLFLEHPLFVSLREGIIEGCHSCPHLEVCGGDRNAAYADSKNLLGIDPGCWKQTFNKEKVC